MPAADGSGFRYFGFYFSSKLLLARRRLPDDGDELRKTIISTYLVG